MRLLVTGATGYLGGIFLKHCESLGLSTATLRRELTDSQINETMKDFGPDVVIHFASLFIGEHKGADVVNLIQSNLEYGTRILEAMKSTGCRKIVTAGSAWQDYEQSGRPSNLYAATKNAFEEIVRYYCDAYEMNAISLRIFDSGGPNDPRPKLLPILARKAKLKESLELNEGAQQLHFVHSKDIAEAFRLAALRLTEAATEKFEVFHLSSDQAITLRELIEQFQKKNEGYPSAQWGVRPYRHREVMVPFAGGKRLPGWKPRLGLDKIIEDVVETENRKSPEV